MTSADDTLPRRAVAEASTEAPAAPRESAPADIGTEIATIEVVPDTGLDPATGEPRRPWSAWLAVGALHAGTAAAGAGLLWAWWRSVHEFPQAALLHRLVLGEAAAGTGQGEDVLARVLLVVALFVIALAIGAAATIAGYYGWRGYGWARWAGLIAAALSAAAVLLNEVAWVGIPLIVVGAAALWLPPTRRFFARWHAHRHPEPPYPAIAEHVFYGPLPRYV